MRKQFPYLGTQLALLIWAAVGWAPFAPQAAQNSQSAALPWEQQIRAYEKADKLNPPPRNAVLFIGSSSIAMWKNLGKAFPGHQVINRGFGGSYVSDAVAYADRIVIPYRPKLVLLYAGDNDIAAHKSPEQVLNDFKAFVSKVEPALPGTRIGYLSIKPCPNRESLLETAKKTNRLIRKYASSDDRLLFVDLFTPMLNEEGRPRADLFIADGLHPNERCYDLWASILQPVLDKADPPRASGD